MPDCNHYNIPEKIAHVRRSVCRHGFADSAEWAASIYELADLTDDEIEDIASDVHDPIEPNGLHLLVLADRPTGLNPDQLATFVRLRLKGLGRKQALAEVGCS